MWSRPLITGVLAVTICAGTSLSTGSGSASALPTKEIEKIAEKVVPPVAERLGLSRFLKPLEDLFVSQATKLTPVLKEADLPKFNKEWTSFLPRKPLPEEVGPAWGRLPTPYRQAGQMLCGTAVDLLAKPDKAQWEYLITQVDNQIAAQNPLGKKLVIYSDLNEIYMDFRRGCICAATAELAVFYTKQRYCEGGE
ncbi:hypothetical protein [Nocardia tengchongensis]|uniref:hypothetical protein n=1 Tax=Nocardia tengchongensis TaxID=2055889 RepID=UPI0036BEE69E